MQQIEGSFDVKLTPQPAAEGQAWGRQSIEKTFHGALAGSSRGEMLAVRTAVPGSAGYVALEEVKATLEGRSGSFFLQHFGLMDKGTPSLTVSVVPDSATGELTGLQGTMQIDVTGGQHRYTFTYKLPAK
ncbi:DUF3224 domain-containing protein [Pseudoduganella sp. DS3]|uniref:DUF3224 domain-containing protein n=1 Tax=Pseudoduganella guangdongensis TaxID=2692179 RepID=A0A6N9HCB3_9BURK|nr:DUF3224 domain-containing protein [Pseudoduganella guangdongensis]MYN00782.1 DUF3224 domain-containing protein [Pseudoduganella guangdongensis]